MDDHTVAVDATQTPTALTFADVFNVAVPFIDRHVAEGRGAKVAIRDAAGDVTYAALAAAVNRAGNALAALGLDPGDRVLMVVKDCPAFFYLFWGAIKAGFVPVPLNTLLRAPDYRFVIENSRAACIVWSPEFATEVEPALAEATHRPACTLPVEGEGESFAARLAAASDALRPAPATADDPAFWLYTSGSTGTPKGGVHRHRDMVVTSQYFGVDTLGITSDDVHFSAAKLFFAYGLGNGMTFPALDRRHGGSPRPPADAGHDVCHHRSVPADRLLRRADALRRAAPSAGERGAGSRERASLRLGGRAAAGGDPRTLARHHGARHRGRNRHHRDPAHLHLQPPRCGGAGDEWYARAGLRGAPRRRRGAGRGARRDRQPADPRASLIAEYWGEPERTAAAFDGEWLRTGDTYRIDANGCYVCCGRSDDMLKVGGIWVSPVEIEARLIAHSAVLEAAVVGRADDDGLIKPEAWVVLAGGQIASERLSEALVAHCKAGLARYKYPRWLRYVDTSAQDRDRQDSALQAARGRLTLRAPSCVTAQPNVCFISVSPLESRRRNAVRGGDGLPWVRSSSERSFRRSGSPARRMRTSTSKPSSTRTMSRGLAMTRSG